MAKTDNFLKRNRRSYVCPKHHSPLPLLRKSSVGFPRASSSPRRRVGHLLSSLRLAMLRPFSSRAPVLGQSDRGEVRRRSVRGRPWLLLGLDLPAFLRLWSSWRLGSGRSSWSAECEYEQRRSLDIQIHTCICVCPPVGIVQDGME